MIKKEEYMRFLKKYQKVHCQPISLLKKSELKKLAEKHGFNNPEIKQDETKNSLTDFFPESKAKQKKPKKITVVASGPTLEQVRKMLKDHDVSSEIQVAMSIPEYRKWSAEHRRLREMLPPPIKKVKS